ncbi:beta-1,3-galactosyltransferase 5-like [Antedon mediterranea]|uniref:beta-1,3-galactosyltransferase 5-like n=1 Tax=Antedon mediterranea TaxID=105859 RepID=UPI003AF59554
MHMVSMADYIYAMLRILSRTTMSSTFLFTLLFVFTIVMLSVMRSDIKVMSDHSFDHPVFDDLVRSNYKLKSVLGTTWNVQRFTDVFPQDTSCQRNIALLVLVTSAPDHFERRASIRSTWASRSNDDNASSWQVVFLLGKTNYQATQILLDNEMQRHNDMLQGNFIDSYRNLTLKVQNGFSWAAKFCQPQYLLKTDDDCFVNVKLMSNFLLNHNTITSNLYAGNKMKSLEVVRRDDSKWRVSRDDYPHEEYPPYASGTGYLLSGDVVEKVVKAARHIKPFPVEDAYMGVIAEFLNLDLIDTGRFTLYNANWNTCNYRYLFVVHHILPEQQYVCQNNTIESVVKCADQKEITRWD